MATGGLGDAAMISGEAVRCALWARAQDVDPVGTVGSYEGFLLVECPLPWPRDISEIESLRDVKELSDAAGLRLQGLVPRGEPGERRVALYRRTKPFVGFSRSERVVPASDVAGAVAELLSTPLPAGTSERLHEVLICTHGRRDRCCGSLGTELARSLLAEPAALGPGVEVWRTSHTGGHRFAPTAIVFPEGTAWAFADIDGLARVLARRGDLDDLLPRYRGCAGLDSPRVQALERAVLAEVGWELFGRPRWGSDDGSDAVRLFVAQAREVVTWEADVAPGRKLPVPDCGAPIDQARKFEAELVVTGLRRRG